MLGDILGYSNGKWLAIDIVNSNETISLDTVNEYIYEFIDLGGINGINIKDWIFSQNTYYNFAISKTLLKHNIDDKDFYDNIKSNLGIVFIKMNEETTHGIQRLKYSDDDTFKYIKLFSTKKNATDARTTKYNKYGATNTPTIYGIIFGLAFYKESDLDKLIELSINITKLTHNAPMGFLAGFTSAYFMSLAIREIDITKWVFMLLDIIESDKIKKYINVDSHIEYMDYLSYIRYWKKYLEIRFNDNKPIKSRSTQNMMYRLKFYYENFCEDEYYKVIGMTGLSALIMTYDSLIDCNGKFEKLIFYTVLHFGSPKVGALSCALYGAIYGLGDVPQNLLCCIEKKSKILKLAQKFYKYFYEQ